MSWFRIFRRLFMLLGGAFMAFGMAACKADLPPPTEAEVKQTVQIFLTEVYGKNDGGAVFKDITLDFGAIEVGKVMQKQMDVGGVTRSVYPVKVPVKITVTFSNNPTIHTWQRGERSDDVFFFYKDGFDKWTFRTGQT